MQDTKDPKEQRERNRTPRHSSIGESSPGAKDDQVTPADRLTENWVRVSQQEWSPMNPLCSSFGEEGREESVISSMSEWEGS